jgi:predicted protein tyrosine phosphatase
MAAADGRSTWSLGISPMRRVLFICSQNRLRSPTAKRVFSTWPGIEVASAGLEATADTPLSPELLEWADLIFVMERSHRDKLSKQYRRHLKNRRVICLDIPDEYEYMDPRLVMLLKARVPRHLGTATSAQADA